MKILSAILIALAFTPSVLAQVPKLQQGGTGLTTAADDTIPISNGTDWEAKTLPDCGTSAGILHYTASSNSWTCDAISQPEIDVTTAGMVCDGTTDDTTAFNTLAGTANRGLLIPATKFCKLTGPVTLASGVMVRCAGTSGFTIGTRVCVGGSMAGASCATDTQCTGGGTCTGTAFAPNSGTGYPMFVSAAGSAFNAMLDCTFRASGIDGYQTCVGGSAVGQPCTSKCAGGVNSGKLCVVNGDCPTSTCTMDTGSQCAGGGVCNGPAGYPSGKMTAGSAPSSGNVEAVDFNNAASSRVENNRFDDLRQTDFVIRLGSNGIARANHWMTYSAETINGNDYVNNPAGIAAARVTTGLQTTGAITALGATSFTLNNDIRNWGGGVAIAAEGATNGQIIGNTVIATTSTGTYGIIGPGQFSLVFNNTFQAMGLALEGVLLDSWISNNTFSIVGTPGPCALMVTGAGVHVEHNHLLISYALCTGGGTSLRASGTAHNSFRYNYGVSFAPINIFAFRQGGKRCNGGSKVYEACTNDNITDCPGATCGNCCLRQVTTQLDLTGNTGMGYLDLSDITALDDVDLGGSLIYDSNISETNLSGTATTGIIFPTVPLRCKAGANLNASCTKDTCVSACGAGATCPGDCVSAISAITVNDNAIGSLITNSMTGWNDAFGVLTNNTRTPLGAPLQTFQSDTPAGDKLVSTVRGCRVATTTTGTSTLCTFPITSNKTLTADVIVTAHCTTGASCANNNSAAYKLFGACKNNAGTTTALVGSPDTYAAAEDVTGWEATIACDNTTDSLQVNVTGAATTTITWQAIATLTENGL